MCFVYIIQTPNSSHKPVYNLLIYYHNIHERVVRAEHDGKSAPLLWSLYTRFAVHVIIAITTRYHIKILNTYITIIILLCHIYLVKRPSRI